jgi:hypothetical protein
VVDSVFPSFDADDVVPWHAVMPNAATKTAAKPGKFVDAMMFLAPHDYYARGGVYVSR